SALRRAAIIGVTLLLLASERNRFQSTPRAVNSRIVGPSANGPDTAQHRSNSSLSASVIHGVGEFILIAKRIALRILVYQEAVSPTLVLIWPRSRAIEASVVIPPEASVNLGDRSRTPLLTAIRVSVPAF